MPLNNHRQEHPRQKGPDPIVRHQWADRHGVEPEANGRHGSALGRRLRGPTPHASHMTRNPASRRVLQKIGMRHEGCLRQHVNKWEVFEDLALYGLLKSEREEVRP